MSDYYGAQICNNGHLITAFADIGSELIQKYCSTCGAKTIMSCSKCNEPIRGRLRGSWPTSEFDIPAYCYNCGNPYPWTEAALEAATLLINEDENLNSEEKQQFCETLPDLVVKEATPKTKLAAARFKKFISKSASYTADGIRDIFVDITSEAIKKSLGL